MTACFYLCYENEFNFTRIKNHINGVALSLALKQRLESTRKWPIHLSLVNSALLVLPQKSRTDYRINRDFVFQLNFLALVIS